MRLERTRVRLLNQHSDSYRLFLFRRMHEMLKNRGWEFELWFMASSESNRHWNFAPSDFGFAYRFLSGKRFRLVRSSLLYWSCEITQVLREANPDILLASGAWVHPTVFLASLSSIPVRKIFWSESHFGSIRQRGFIVDCARRSMLSRFSEFAIPGELARNYIVHHSSPARIHHFPAHWCAVG